MARTVARDAPVGTRLVHPSGFSGLFSSGGFEATVTDGVLVIPAEFVPSALMAGFRPDEPTGHAGDGELVAESNPHAGSRTVQEPGR